MGGRMAAFLNKLILVPPPACTASGQLVGGIAIPSLTGKCSVIMLLAATHDNAAANCAAENMQLAVVADSAEWSQLSVAFMQVCITLSWKITAVPISEPITHIPSISDCSAEQSEV